MTRSASSGLVKSMVVIGSAQAVTIALSIVRLKILAVQLGPAGLGLFSIYNSLQGLVQQAAGLGMSSSGVREIAASRGEEAPLSRVRRVLLAAHLVQGTLALLAVWIMREQISIILFDDNARALQVGLIGVAILLGLFGSAQTALLQGLRKIADLGSVTVFGACFGTVIGLAAVWLQGENGLIYFVLAQPLGSTLIALHYTRRLPKPSADRPSLVETWTIWKSMAKLGFAFMLGGFATTATLLLVRGRISQELGLDAAGQFAASWGITMTYVGFLLGAMGADYYPRLTEVIQDRKAAVQLMNDQVQLGLAIGGPVLLLLVGLAPLVITSLYSAEFGPAVGLLQVQTFGNIFKLASWPLGFSLAAGGHGKTFLLVQINFNVLFLLVLWPTLGPFGIQAAGPAFTIAYLLHFILLNFLVRNIHGFLWQRLSLGLIILHAVLAFALLAAALTFPLTAALLSPILALLTGLFGLRVVLSKIGPESRIAARFSELYARFGWPLKEVS